MILRKHERNEEIREHMRGGDGEARLSALTDSLPGNLRLFTMITLAPGCSIGEHTHENETELFYFVQGEADALDDGERVQLRAGDTMRTPSGHSHAVANRGGEDLMILACIVKD